MTEKTEDDIHVASEGKPIITRYEPGFRRFYARGSLVHNEDDDPHVVALAFWSNRHEDIKIADDQQGVGYALEAEGILTWEAAERLHRLLGKWLSERRPQPTATKSRIPAASDPPDNE